MSNITVTDYDIQALVDEEIEPPAALTLLQAIQRDPALFKRYLLYKRQKTLLKNWWKDN